jgi:Rps23 Pro-64 3,4-dihydroxylase Tpa1-like proline 4-hydroxylase
MTTELLEPEFLARLEELGRTNSERYQTNQPFPSIWLDNFLPAAAVDAALRDFPKPDELKWHSFDDKNQKKKSAFYVAEALPQSIRNVLYFMNSKPMLQFLELLTGIQGLIPDPYFVGGGIHQIGSGGKLDIHVDFNRHERMRLDRRLNVLIYLNKEWDESYGGHFELWNRDMSAAATRILPVFNRCAIFTTSPYSYHGHPTPITCPPDRMRRSIALYYYTNGRPEEEIRDAHSTIWQKARPAAASSEMLPTRLARKLVHACRELI